MLENIPFTQHCFGGDMMLNMPHLTSTGTLVKGDVYLMIDVGLGGHLVQLRSATEKYAPMFIRRIGEIVLRYPDHVALWVAGETYSFEQL